MTHAWPSGFRVMVTGHRDVRGARAEIVRQTLMCILLQLKERNPDGLVAISGMAVGADIEFAEAALDLGCPLVAAIPTDTQDALWPHEARVRYSKVLRQASLVVSVWEETGYSTRAIGPRFHARDRWMVDHSTDGMAIAVWDGRKVGGTWATLKEILRRGRKVLVIDPQTGAVRIEKTSDTPKESALDLFGVAEK